MLEGDRIPGPGRTRRGALVHWRPPPASPEAALPVLQERQFDMVIERLDRLGRELELIGRRLEVLEVLIPLARELGDLSRATTTLAHAAMGRQGPQIRRERGF